MYDIAFERIDILFAFPIVITIDRYGAYSDNAGSIYEMVSFFLWNFECTDAYDNIYIAFKKRFFIWRACINVLILFDGFVTFFEEKAFSLFFYKI